jgi:hypothetical protein
MPFALAVGSGGELPELRFLVLDKERNHGYQFVLVEQPIMQALVVVGQLNIGQRFIGPHYGPSQLPGFRRTYLFYLHTRAKISE